jgi:hypothetical protein
MHIEEIHIMTKEYLVERKTKYQERHDYYKKLGFDVLASDFQGIVDLIEEMEKCAEGERDEKD